MSESSRPVRFAPVRRVSSLARATRVRWYHLRVRFLPDMTMDRVESVDAAFLAKAGLQGLLVDLDETVVPAGSVRPSATVRRWAAELAAAGSGVVIVSNGTPARVRSVAATLGVQGLPLAGKPWAFAFRRGIARLGLPAERVAMVGDQLFTDVLGARACGLRTILVPPLSPGGLPHTRLLRRLERRILRGGDHGRPVHR